MGLILVLNRRLIPNNTKKYFMKYQNISSKNPLQLHVVHDCYFVDKQIIDIKIHLFRFCLYIVKGWGDTPINPILNLEEPVGKSIFTYNFIRKRSENITTIVLILFVSNPQKKMISCIGMFPSTITSTAFSSRNVIEDTR